MRSLTYQRPDITEIKFLYQLIKVADHSVTARIELLSRLRFISEPKNLYKVRFYVLKILDTYLDPILAVIITLFVAAIINPKWGSIAFLTLTFLIAYIRWVRSQRNENVEDAIMCKDKANSMIVEHTELLLPYIENVFGFEAQYTEQHLDDIRRAKIDMYVFTEIDNLEFVFDKSRAGLIEDHYTVRAIKIFVTRTENEAFFNVARRLIVSGQYNENFAQAAVKLLYVGRFDSSKLET